MLDTLENDCVYAPYPHTFSSPMRPIGMPVTLSDPFDGSPALAPIVEPAQQRFQPCFVPASDSGPRACSVCGRASGPLAVLEPCAHPLCSACLTGALNIVGEKDMACAVCETAVRDFRLQPPAEAGPGDDAEEWRGGGRLLPSALDSVEYANPLCFFDRSRASSTPVADTARHGTRKIRENVVLRIDNVPWVSL
jgi:hypothetical protein